MTLTFAQLQAHVDHALAGAPVTPGTQAQLVNEAGRILCQSRDWKFLERPPQYLSFTANQEYITLPADVGQVLSISANQNNTWGFVFTTMAEIVRMRQTFIVAPSFYAGAIDQPTQTNATTAPGPARLELYPTPGTSISNVLLMEYRGKWTEMSGSTDLANIPLYCESLLIALCRAMGQGYEESENASVTARITEILNGPLMAAAAGQDGMIQPQYGPLIGGACDLVGNQFSYTYPAPLPAPS